MDASANDGHQHWETKSVIVDTVMETLGDTLSTSFPEIPSEIIK